MATQLEQILTFTAVPAGGQATLPHNLNWTGRAVKPDLVFRDNGVFSIISTTANQITVQNNSLVAETLNLYIWSLHTEIRAYGGSQFTSLNPMPFVPAAGGNGGGQIAAISAGTQVANTGTIVFSNSNGVTFGMGGSSFVTATVDGIKSVGASNATLTNGMLVFQNGGNVTFGIAGSTVTASVQTAGGTASGIGIVVGTATQTTGAVVFSNSNNVSVGYNASTITWSAAFGGVAAGGVTQTAGTVRFSNSNGVTFGLAGSTVTASVAIPSISQVINYTATGGETDFSVTMGAVANTNYAVFAQNASMSRLVVWDVPIGTANRVNTAFRAIPSGSLVSGDVVQFFLFAS